MNTSNNARYQATHQKIQQITLQLLEHKTIDKITVSEICRNAHVNRTTFYLHFTDVKDLIDKIETELMTRLFSAFWDDKEFSFHRGVEQVFSFVKKHALFYRTYFQQHVTPNLMQQIIPQDSKGELSKSLGHKSIIETEYHEKFFLSGLTGMLYLWLQNGCTETPEEMGEILVSEYQSQQKPEM